MEGDSYFCLLIRDWTKRIHIKAATIYVDISRSDVLIFCESILF